MSQAKVKILITAAEAYPELERMFLTAQTEIELGFRIFDPQTRLLSPEAQAVGDTWFHLIIHTLKRGVRLRFVLADFDPVAGAAEHRGTWHAVRQLAAAREIAGPQAQLEVIAAMHPAKMGLLPRLLLWAKIRTQLRSHCKDINALDPDQRARALREMPALRPNLTCQPSGTWVPRLGNLPFLRPATHHQKLAVADQRVLYIGGLDLNNRRIDTPDHTLPADQTWHDVQLLITDSPAVQAAHNHLVGFLDVVAQRRPAAPPAPPFLRTLSTKRRFRLPFMSPASHVTELSEAHHRLSAQAKQLIYLETQFFRDLRYARQLARLARANPALRLILVLPAAPDDVAFGNSGRMDARFGEYLQARCLRIVRRGFGTRLTTAAPVQRRAAKSHKRDTLHGAPLIYVHAKVSIFDDAAAIVSSANLNGRSLAWDTEAGVLLDDAAHVRDLRQRCFSHWFPDETDGALFDLATAQPAWRGVLHKNRQLPPDQRRGLLVPYDLTPAEQMGQALPLIPPEMV
jgi:phosphatidylserine/phosphatidylglycerophosphate/cardiolipin synthase-like enzyme